MEDEENPNEGTEASDEEAKHNLHKLVMAFANSMQNHADGMDDEDEDGEGEENKDKEKQSDKDEDNASKGTSKED